jgi:septal ring factor EnvC (AmiA/AmiB activator)
MIRAGIIGLAVWMAGVAHADPAETAQEAAADLSRAAAQLARAADAPDRIAALTETIQAYEAGLAALRESLQDTLLAERAIRQSFAEDAQTLSVLLAALAANERTPRDAALLHPGGPLEAARAGMILADVTPALEAKVRALKEPLIALSELSALRSSAETTLSAGLEGIQDARAKLGAAVSERTRPDASPTDTAALQAIVNSADTLEGFAATLSGLPDQPGGDTAFSAQKGTLSLPVKGRVATRYNQTGTDGVARPGLTLATVPRSVVTAPFPSTVRYAGPLLDLGLVAILEPEAGYLLVLAGLGEIFSTRGEVLDQNAPIGLMGGKSPQSDWNLKNSAEDSGQASAETLYIELRRGGETLDPTDWFGPAED